MSVTTEQREEIKQLMLVHLTSQGWQRGNDQMVFNQLPVMWKKLVESGLIKKFTDLGFSYVYFKKTAERSFLKKEMGINF